MRWEYPEVHLLNFAILIVTLFCFEFFWRELLAVREEGAWAGASRQYAWAMGYLLFANSILILFLPIIGTASWDRDAGPRGGRGHVPRSRHDLAVC